VTVYVSTAPGHVTFPLTRLHALFDSDCCPADSPLFIGQDGLPLLHADFIKQLWVDLVCLGLDPSSFAGHSFCHRDASSAAAAGFHNFELQQLGHWHSDAYRLYIEPTWSHLLSLSSWLHWAIPIAQDCSGFQPARSSLHSVVSLSTAWIFPVMQESVSIAIYFFVHPTVTTKWNR
jgi:hypothetical protein